MINPTGRRIRNDSGGSGGYGSKRGARLHKGTDFFVIPGEKVFSPISGVVTRIANPYSGTKAYSGLVIRNSKITIKMFYLLPYTTIVGKEVTEGQDVGIAQDISKYYPGQKMEAHIHLEVDHIDPMLLINLP